MKKITSYKLQVTSYKLRVTSYSHRKPLTSYLIPLTSYLTPLTSYLIPLFAFCFLPFALNAQTDENIILSAEDVQKNELIVTPEIEKAVVTWLKNLPERAYSEYGITSKTQLENLSIGKPVPKYAIVNEELKIVHTYNVARMADENPLSLRFFNNWYLPIMADEGPFLFAIITFSDCPHILGTKNTNAIEHFYNYKHKDSIIGSVGNVIPGIRDIDFLIIRKENKDIFVEIYDETTGEYLKNEYSFSELINHLKELDLREKEKRNRYYAQIADKTELEMTPEITEMLITQAYSSHINDSDKSLSDWGIKDRAQLENLHLGKPIPEYMIVNENLTFTGYWEVPVMSDSEPLFRTSVKLGDNGQYTYAGSGGPTMIGAIRNYEHKDLIIGILKVPGRGNYIIIRKDNTDIFVKSHNSEKGEVLIEYSLSEIINLFKK